MSYLREESIYFIPFQTWLQSRQIFLKVKTETALENHVKSHSGIRDLKCDICDATFASRYTLNAHVKRHAITEPLFACPYCGKGSKSKANLEQHIRIHTGVRPYSCNVCSAAYVILTTCSYCKEINLSVVLSTGPI